MPTLGGGGEEHVGALPFSDVNGLLSASAAAEKQQAVVAHIFPLLSHDATDSSSDILAQLVTLRTQIVELENEKVADATGGSYIWHKEGPSVSIDQGLDRRSRGTSLSQPHLVFRLRTGGECVEDEWFATYILLEATKHFPEHQLVISVENEDGQFLLIEAAAQLPSWITPENATNRVWLFNGQLHLITPHLIPDNEDSIDQHSAIAQIRDSSILTRAPEAVETAALARIQDYPGAAADNHHQTLAYLPRIVAQLLSIDPQLVSTCISAIQSRDVMSSRASSKMTHFPPPDTPPSTASSDSDQTVILTPVRMTRYLYAQLSYDRFFPPRQLGRTWQAAVEKYRMRLHQSERSYADSQDGEMLEGRWRDLGAKIWCGMEMAYDESLSRQRRASTVDRSTTSSIPGNEHDQFVSRLQMLGYFGDETQGSARWKTLEAEAMQQIKAGTSGNEQTSAQDGSRSFSETINALRKQRVNSTTAPVSVDTDSAQLSASKFEDSDDWMYLTDQDLEDITASKSAAKADPLAKSGEEDAFNRLNSFTSKLDSFMTTRSDAQGALFADEVDMEEELSDDDLLFEDLDEEEQERRVQREVQQRIQQTTPEERLKFLQTLIPRMTAEEWAARPAVATAPTQEDNTVTASKDGLPEQSKNDFVSSIDQLAAEKAAAASDAPQPSSQVTALAHLSRAQEELQRRLASQYMREASAKMSTQPYEGASDSDSDDLEQETSPEVRRQLAKEYDLELDDEVDAAGVDDDADMLEAPELNDEDEMENLLEFARTSLGLSKEQYAKILQDRAQQGKFVPSFTKTAQAATDQNQSKGKGKEVSTADETGLPTSSTNTAKKLDTFESVMGEMDSRLAGLQRNQQSKGKDVEPKLEDEEQELLAHLLKSGGDLPSSLWSGLAQGGPAGSSEDMIRAQQAADFLKSFQAQSFTSGPGSSSGPVETLMRRFGLGSLPADADTQSASQESSQH